MYELVISCWLLATAVGIIKLLILAIQPQTTEQTHTLTHIRKHTHNRYFNPWAFLHGTTNATVVCIPFNLD